VRGKWSKFSVDTLLTLAAKAGLHPRLNLVAVRSASMHALSIDT
jgi:predicted XRE-type DNA-binding protein